PSSSRSRPLSRKLTCLRLSFPNRTADSTSKCSLKGAETILMPNSSSLERTKSRRHYALPVAAQLNRLARSNDCRSDDINSIKENTDEVHDQLVRTSARIADGVRECSEADPGGFHSMEGTR